MSFDQKRVVDAIRAFEAGEIVVVTDDGGRENEGDLIVAAVHCTPEKMAFIVRHTSGIVCTPMPREEAKRLNLGAMVAENDSAHTTAFTVSVDFKHGTTTGISADDRTLTVRNLANPNVGATDFVRPGDEFIPFVLDAHFGRWGGWWGRIGWAVLGLAPAALFVTGFLVWWRGRRRG